ncbi:MAG TPA: tetratricopeptide repeat protein [Bacteroidota bacterium]|nr:tetratricopeptide repeat protein [Bacteroidota bacterium]
MASKKNICPWCGIANADDAVHCVGCGSDLKSQHDSVRQSEEETSAAPVSPSATKPEPAKPNAAAAQQAGRQAQRSTKKREAGSQIRPGYVYATIAAIVILGYLYLKKDAPQPAAVPQNTSLMQGDSTAQQLRSMEEFLASHPNDSQAQLAYANMLHDAGQYPKAIAAYTKYLATDPKNADARVDMAICLFQSGDSPTAIVELKKALEHSPKHQPAMFNLGVVYLNQGKTQESNDWFSRCVAIDPGSPVGARAKQLLTQHSSTNKNTQ